MADPTKQQLYRQRQREGVRMLSVPITQDVCEQLIERGYLHPWQDDDRRAVAEAVGRLLSDLVSVDIIA